MMGYVEDKQRLQDHVERMIGRNGFDADVEWKGSVGMVTAVDRMRDRRPFSVHFRIDGNRVEAGIVMPDELTKGVWPLQFYSKKEVKDRSFSYGMHDEAAKQRFAHAMKAAADAARESLDREATGERNEALAERLQELVDRDPSNAGAAIAQALADILAEGDVETLVAAIEAAASEASNDPR